jgi:hypothetical protein
MAWPLSIQSLIRSARSLFSDRHSRTNSQGPSSVLATPRTRATRRARSYSRNGSVALLKTKYAVILFIAARQRACPLRRNTTGRRKHSQHEETEEIQPLPQEQHNSHVDRRRKQRSQSERPPTRLRTIRGICQLGGFHRPQFNANTILASNSSCPCHTAWPMYNAPTTRHPHQHC